MSDPFRSLTVENWEKVLPSNSQLQKHLPACLKKVRGDDKLAGLKIFVPLCGKSRDLMFLYNQGCTVVGVEKSKKVIDEFFSENNIQRSLNSNPAVHTSADGRMIIAEGDILSFTKYTLPKKQFDVVWDVGAFAKVNFDSRRKYADLVSCQLILKEENGIYMMDAFQFDASELIGSPHSVSREDLETSFKYLKVELLHTEQLVTAEVEDDSETLIADLKKQGISRVSKNLFLLKSKVQKQPTDRSLATWIERWDIGRTLWREEKGNQLLQENIDKIMLKHGPHGKSAGDISAFIPLCGDSFDMMFFYKRGYKVIGVECAQKAIDKFFADNKLEKGESTMPNSTCTSDGRITLICDDIFNIAKESLPVGTFDIVWDHGGFSAVNIGDRARFAKLTTSLLSKDGIYLLEASRFDKREHSGPPCSIYHKEDVEKNFSNMKVEIFGMKELMTEDNVNKSTSMPARFKRLGVTELTRNLFLIQHK